MSIKIVNEYITEVLQLKSFEEELKQAKSKHRVQPVSPSSNTNPDDQRSTDQNDSNEEDELEIIKNLGLTGNPMLRKLTDPTINQTR